MLTDHHVAISEIFERLKAGDDNAMDTLWYLYFEHVKSVASKRIGSFPKRAKDEEDILVSVFHKLWDGARKERFNEFNNRNELWFLLLQFTNDKVCEYVRHETAKKRDVAKTVDAEPLGAIAGKDPARKIDEVTDKKLKQFIAALGDDTLRQIAELKLQLLTNKEIAEELGVSERTVERKYKLILAQAKLELAKI